MSKTVTPSQDRPEVAIMRDLRLDSILLWECAVKRGGAASITIGDVRAKLNLEHAIGDDGELQFTVDGSYDFINEVDELIATITSTYVLEYVYHGDAELSSELASKFAPSVVMQVTPFHREFLATMTNRLGMPPFYLPLMRRNELKVETSAETGAETP